MKTFPNYFRLLLVSVFLIASCSGREQNVTAVDFFEGNAGKLSASENENALTLRVAIAAVISPRESFIYYRDLFDYMAERLDMKVEFMQRMSYGEVNGLLERNLVDMAFICTGAYIEGSDNFDLLVAPLTNNQPHYNAYLITNDDSGIDKFEDTRGRSFAFTDHLSFTGRIYALKRLADLGETPDSFFEDITYTMSHDISIQMVSRNLVDAAAISGLIFDYLEIFQPEKVRNIRVIEKSENFGMPPVVSSLLMDQELKLKIQQLFIDMHNDERGKETLSKLLIDRFEIVDDSLYNSVRKIRDEVWQ
jgi:phosphonate transport system substrate-binding protein